MTSETGCMKLRRRTTLGRGLNPRGARHWGAASRHQTEEQQGLPDCDRLSFQERLAMLVDREAAERDNGNDQSAWHRGGRRPEHLRAG